MKITNPELKQLDEQVAEFYKLTARYFGANANLYGRGIYKKELSNILNKADKIIPEAEFDGLVLKNIQSNLRLNDLVLDYCADPDFSLSVKDFFNKIAGKGSYEFLEARMKFPLHKKRWEYSEKTQERDFARVNSFTEEAQTSAKAWIPKIKKDILEYGKKQGLLPRNFDMTILLLPPKDSGEYSDWNPATKVFNLGSYGFDFFYRDKNVVAIPAKAYNVAFHEVLGHGAHQIHSKAMPLSTKFTEEIGYITPTKSIIEGIAMNSEKMAEEFLMNKLDELRITKEEVDILQTENELGDQSRLETMYSALLKDRELREKDFNGYEHLLNLTQNPVVARIFKENFKGSFGNVWRQTGHTLGPLHYKKMEDYLRKKFGEEYLNKNQRRFHKASLTGVWSWKVYPAAVCYFLKEEE